MKLVTVQEMKALEKAADKAGHSYDTMMELAGRAVAHAIESKLDVRAKRVLILVGPGNNGGDGLVAARYLSQAGAQVVIYLAKSRADDDPNLSRLQECDVEWVSPDQDTDRERVRQALQTADVLIDALLGTGVDRPIEGILADILQDAQQITRSRRSGRPEPLTYLSPQRAEKQSKAPIAQPLIVAVDVPSGVNCDTGAVDPVTLPADLTITFAAAKPGQFRFPAAKVLGQLAVAEIGIPDELSAEIQTEVATHAQVAKRLPARPPDAHKGTFGKAMIVAGSANYVGAACLSAAAAGRIGAGLVTLAAPSTLHAVLAQSVAEATHLLLPHDMGALVPGAIQVLADHLKDYASLLIGPGLGQAAETALFVQQLFGIEGDRRARQIGFQRNAEPHSEALSLPPTVVDADALNALASVHEWWRHLPENCVLTPHPGEMGRLMGAEPQAINEDRTTTATQQAAAWQQVVVLKGAFTVVSAPDGQTTVLPFSTAALSTAGTGDVLAGSIAGLLAQGLCPYDAALCGAYLHGLAGILLEEEMGDAGTVAGDLLPLLPRAIRQVRSQ